ncbi:hypothetical protein F6R98_10275 [Candidatus Methylospira mobilis]|uniref:Uncharacterized protein n=1 Tax=Candidatus Methylospira mobilis TaxID=1808979 RepID=A0A5Q0BGM0_9GAMM|nr:hypothetical protein [Candidatus Methylospira mobilis]QFY42950.1 hypothetical protein F6R98_10275 [Candidatus Methylospira mobilis]
MTAIDHLTEKLRQSKAETAAIKKQLDDMRIKHDTQLMMLSALPYDETRALVLRDSDKSVRWDMDCGIPIPILWARTMTFFYRREMEFAQSRSAGNGFALEQRSRGRNATITGGAE